LSNWSGFPLLLFLFFSSLTHSPSTIGCLPSHSLFVPHANARLALSFSPPPLRITLPRNLSLFSFTFTLKLVRGCPKLRVLNLFHLTDVTDVGLASVAKHCKNLVSLQVCDFLGRGGGGVTDSDYRLLVKRRWGGQLWERKRWHHELGRLCSLHSGYHTKFILINIS
jgi:hypothetical protein